ncbi:hypothetical protein Leryth_006665, partial [Lithospermum erythrorhizon]
TIRLVITTILDNKKFKNEKNGIFGSEILLVLIRSG